MILDPSRWNIEHVTEIDAPIDDVWLVLININDWNWNAWTRLDAPSATTGVSGKLRASFDGDGTWTTYDFRFREVDNDKHLIEWGGSVAGGMLFKGRHSMRLEEIKPGTTRLMHVEEFGGLLPAFGAGLPYRKLDRNYRLMNEALKAHVERR
uniref:Coenzyme Q-binding protein COQ10 START domain-containing protein n=1 Tax=Trieres chinensis TaxID=1514140 RepID=A0A7S2EYC1_TRICV